MFVSSDWDLQGSSCFYSHAPHIIDFLLIPSKLHPPVLPLGLGKPFPPKIFQGNTINYIQVLMSFHYNDDEIL